MRAAFQMLTTILRLAALLVISTGAKGDLLLGGVSGADLHWSRIPVRSTVGAKSPTNSPPGAASGAGSGIGAYQLRQLRFAGYQGNAENLPGRQGNSPSIEAPKPSGSAADNSGNFRQPPA